MFDKADSDIKGFGVTYNHYTLYVSGAGSNVETPVETDSNIKTVETVGLDAWRGRKKKEKENVEHLKRLCQLECQGRFFKRSLFQTMYTLENSFWVFWTLFVTAY